MLGQLWMSRGQYYYPKPTILLSSGEVVLGGTAIIYCVKHVKYQEGKIFKLFKVVNSKPVLLREMLEEWNVADFSITNATQSVGGSYVCNYCSPVNNHHCSEYSDIVSFKIIGQPYPKPSIAVIPSGVVTGGQNVSIHCENQGHPQAEFFLHKGQPPLIYGAVGQKALQGKATFSFLNIKQFHAGIYQCKYCCQSDTYKLCSDYSEQVQINMRDPSLPQPAIKVRPKEQISLGSNVTIECWAPESDLNFSLYNSSGLIASQVTKAGRNMTEFIFSVVGLEDAGNYTCQYCVRRRPFLWSEPSDPVELLVASQTQDPTLPKPSIKMIPTRESALGLNVTIQCQGAEKGLTFALQKESMQIAFQTTDAERDTAEFPFFMLRMEDAGNYTCQYHRGNNPFVWSEPSEPVELVLRAHNQLIFKPTKAWIRLGVAGMVMLALMVIVSEAAYSWRREKLFSNPD